MCYMHAILFVIYMQYYVACKFHTRALRHIRHMLSTELAVTIGCSIVASRLDYCNSLLYGAPSTSLDKLQRCQNMLARVVTQSSSRTSAKPLLQSLHWLPIRERIRQGRHSDVQGSSDVITAVPKFAAERSHPVTDAPTFQHAAPDRAENAH